MRLKNNFAVYITATILVFLLSCFCILLWTTDKIAIATGSYQVEIDSIKCLDFDGNEIDYNYTDINQLKYARGIKLIYSINAPNYSIELYDSLNNSIDSINGECIGQKAEYRIGVSGELTVHCYAADIDGNRIQDSMIATKVKSDNLLPNPPLINSMTEWLNPLSGGYRINVELTTDEGNAGLHGAIIHINYADNTETKEMVATTILSFLIVDNCTIDIEIFDKAGNRWFGTYTYNKFDAIPPTAPRIFVTPDPNDYARQYTIRIENGEDLQSGIDISKLWYDINGEISQYNGEFIVNEQKRYTIKAYCYDIVGNRSTEVSTELNKIDRIAPAITSLLFTVDTMREYPYQLSIECGDTDSGLDRIEARGMSLNFIHREYRRYDANFKTLDKATIEISVYDKVGNFSTTTVMTHHFNNYVIEDMTTYFNQMFFTLDREEYSDAGWDKVIALYTDLNISLMSEQTTPSEFDELYTALTQAIDGATTKKYIIASIPEFISTALTYSIDELDLSNRKKGDDITMILNATDCDNDCLAQYQKTATTLTGYDMCFISPFELSFYHNTAQIEYSMQNGIKVSMAVPKDYEARYYSILNLDTNQLLQTEMVNNRIIFTINGGGRFALVTEGSRELTVAPPPEGIKVFGKLISHFSFIITIVGVIVFIILAVVLLTLHHKKSTTNKR